MRHFHPTHTGADRGPSTHRHPPSRLSRHRRTGWRRGTRRAVAEAAEHRAPPGHRRVVSVARGRAAHLALLRPHVAHARPVPWRAGGGRGGGPPGGPHRFLSPPHTRPLRPPTPPHAPPTPP